jgi:hypothetical protein
MTDALPRARRIAPRRVPHVSSCIQCSVPVADPHGAPGWRAAQYAKRNLDPARCALYCSVEIDGRPMCSRHAGERALQILLGE